MRRVIIFIVVLMSILIFLNLVFNKRYKTQKSVYNVEIPDNLKIYLEDYFEKGISTNFGSGITFKGYNENGEMEFYVITDRGATVNTPKYIINGKKVSSKIFIDPTFTPSIGILTIKEDGAYIESKIEIKDEQGNKITGLEKTGGKAGLDINLNYIGYDDNGLDTEGIAIDSEGNFWICDEYEPALIKLSRDGTILEKYTTSDILPSILEEKIDNRGFEGITVMPSGNIIATMQSVLDINGDTGKSVTFIRIIEFNPINNKVRTFAYPIDTTIYKYSKNCKIGDICAIDDNNFLIIEQGELANGQLSNKIYKINLENATDITDLTYNGKELEYAEDKSDLGINFIQKELFLDLRDQGFTAKKVEGICIIDKNTIAIINDNDFGICYSAINEKGEEVDITKYTYDSESSTYYLNGEIENLQLFITESEEKSQIWIFNFEKGIV